MNKEQAIEILKTDSCYECTYGCRSPITCGAEICPLKQATQVAIDSLDNEWVDVRDRLPSESGYYLVSIKGSRETTTWFYGISSDEKGWDEFEGHKDIIAWKPLPQPYERKE